MLLGDHAHGQVVDAGHASAGGVSCGPTGVFFHGERAHQKTRDECLCHPAALSMALSLSSSIYSHDWAWGPVCPFPYPRLPIPHIFLPSQRAKPQ